MNQRESHGAAAVGISAVEREIGLSKDTLRVWERRYGFPQPDRDAFGERLYPVEQVDKLRVIRRLMDAGHRPGRVMSLSIEQLQALSAESGRTATPSPTSRSAMSAQQNQDLLRFMGLVKSHLVDDLRRSLSQAVLRLGLERFVIEIVAPLNQRVGDAWAVGELDVFEEHLYTESIETILRNAISNIPALRPRPYILLTTFPNELHGLGLLMAEAIFALEGARCLSLGTRTPNADIAKAVRSQNIDIVALSFSSVLGTNVILDGLSELRDQLPKNTQIWVGGYCPALTRKQPSGVRVLMDLYAVGPALDQWRKEHLDQSGIVRE
jgi:MerR family transcriptional regulator, light-induced transcriptional regulator